MTERKIIQMAATAGSEGGSDVVYALCDDGSLWELYNDGGHKWSRLPVIPQPRKPATTNHLTKVCQHPAHYATPDGGCVEGWCALCRAAAARAVS